jgi:hypothetical protein
MSSFVVDATQLPAPATRTGRIPGNRILRLRLLVLFAIPIAMTFAWSAHAWAQGCSPG